MAFTAVTNDKPVPVLEVLGRRVDFSIGFVRSTHLIAHADDLSHYLEGLRLAGVPE